MRDDAVISNTSRRWTSSCFGAERVEGQALHQARRSRDQKHGCADDRGNELGRVDWVEHFLTPPPRMASSITAMLVKPLAQGLTSIAQLVPVGHRKTSKMAQLDSNPEMD
jgi:hypothetical protein